MLNILVFESAIKDLAAGVSCSLISKGVEIPIYTIKYLVSKLTNTRDKLDLKKSTDSSFFDLAEKYFTQPRTWFHG